MRKTRHIPLFTCLLLWASTAPAADLQWNGFLNVVGGVLRDTPHREDPTSNAPYYEGYGEDWSFDRHTSAGLQATQRVDEQNAVTVQAFATGEKQYEAELRWLYLTHDLSDHSRLRLGRIGMPLYYYSDFLNVGYAYHWITPPNDVYTYDPTITAIDYTYSQTSGKWDWSAEALVGSERQELPNLFAETTSENFAGTVLTANFDGWLTLRGALMRQRVSFDYETFTTDAVIENGFDEVAKRLAETGIPNAPAVADGLEANYREAIAPIVNTATVVEDLAMTYQALAMRIEQPDWFVMSEWVSIHTEHYTLGSTSSWYVSTGYRFGDTLVHITRSEYEHPVTDEVAADYAYTSSVNPLTLPDAQRADYFGRAFRAGAGHGYQSPWNTWMIGARHELSPAVCVKVDLVRVEQKTSYPGETAGIGENHALSTAVNVLF